MKWMRERKWYLKTMAVGFIGSFFLLFLFYRQAALCFLGAVLGSVCYVRYRIKVQKEQEKWQLMVEFKEAMDSMVSALAAGYSMENAITESYRDMKLLHSEDTRMMRELWDIQQKISLHQPLDEVLSAFASKSGVEDIITFAQIYATARKSGGNLVKVMKRTAQNISEKMEIQREIQTMIAGKKMEANCMTAIPLFIILYLQICSPGFLDPLYEGFFGRLFMTGAFFVYLGAAAWSRHLMKIEC